MISLVTGKVISKNGAEAVILTAGGIGYTVRISPGAAAKCVVGSDVLLDTYFVVREDTQELFGFGNGAERELFKKFLSVSGVGPKTALHLLELGSVEEITMAIGRGDVTYLTRVSGIGKKTAERIVVEIRDKVRNADFGAVSGEVFGQVLTDVVDALITLGYTAITAREVVKQLDANGKTSEQLLREALQRVK